MAYLQYLFAILHPCNAQRYRARQHLLCNDKARPAVLQLRARKQLCKSLRFGMFCGKAMTYLPGTDRKRGIGFEGVIGRSYAMMKPGFYGAVTR
jgi:hypothetical protein